MKRIFLLRYIFLIGSTVFWASTAAFAQTSVPTSVQGNAGGAGQSGVIILTNTAGQLSPPGRGSSGQTSLLGGFIYNLNTAPVVIDTIRDQRLTIGDVALNRDLKTIFSDPDSDSLIYVPRSSNPAIATTSVSGKMLRVTPVAVGNTIITVIADDQQDAGTDSTAFMVTVITGAPNQSPQVANAISTQTLILGCAPFTRDLSTVFSDPDINDKLTYTANSNATSIATVNISSDAKLTVTPIAVGNAIITVTADDGRGGMASTQFIATVLSSYPANFNLSTTVNFPSRPNTADYQPTDYRIVGLPGASDRAVNEFFTGNANEDWKVVLDNGAASNFFVSFNGGAEFKFSVGRAFWVLNKGPLLFNLAAPSAPLDSCRFVSIPLHTGWNLITTPFIFSTPWVAVQNLNRVTEPIFSYNARFDTSASFNPYVGYYFFNRTNLAALKIPYLGSSTNVAVAAVDPARWRVSIALSAGAILDQINSFGVSHEANAGLDRLDFYKPRAIASMPMVVFHRPAWDAKYTAFATDLRPEIAESESWDFEVRATAREAAQLTFSGIGKIPEQFEAYLIDESRARTVNLRHDSLYRFNPVVEASKFSVVVGKRAAVQEKLNSVALPRSFVLGPNYPNPFNPMTTISVAVPVAAEIKLTVYNILGRKVKIIYAGLLEAGRYSFNWEGKDESGNPAATGVYLYRLTTRAGVALLGKMILLR